MAKKIERYSQEALVERLVNEQENINDIDLSKKAQRVALFEALSKRPHLVTKITLENEEKMLSEIIKEKPGLFVYLERRQYNNELAQYYLLHRLEKSDASFEELQVYQSLSGLMVFNYLHTTGNDEIIHYYDNELQIPLSLKSSYKIELKLVDAIKFIEKLDTQITRVGKNKICSTIEDLISNHYKAFLVDYINKNKAGFYKLNISLNEIEEQFKELLAEIFAEYGFEIRDLVIKKIAIPEDIQHKVEDQAFEIRKRKVEMEADAEIAKKSLENYEKKMSLQTKYPNAEFSLTEYEKDLALKRFLIKTGRLQEEEIDHSISIEQITETVDKKVSVKKDDAPEVAPAPKLDKLTIAMIVAPILGIIISAAAESPIPFILGAAAAVAIFFYKKKMKNDGNKEIKK